MKKSTKVLVICLLLGALAPAVVSAFDGSEVFSANTQTYDSIRSQTTNSKQFTTLPGLEMSPVGIGAQVTLNVVMTSGQARFRFASADFDPRPVPIPSGGVVFSAPAANSYAFYERDGCGQFTVEWKRVGTKPATFSTASLQAIGDDTAC